MVQSVTPFSLDGSPFEDAYQLYNVVRVRPLDSTFSEDYDAQQLMLEPKECVVVEQPRGPVLATVLEYPYRKMIPKEELKQVLRLATVEDKQVNQENVELQKEAFAFGLARIRQLDLEMKLVRVQWMLDRSRVVFFYTSPDRVDFRQLVKDLARRFHTRIELHQIGIRDGTAMIGAMGPCGRELCCSRFKRGFGTISITLAKEQGITLKPNKISGLCGRLMCCLHCEHDSYSRSIARNPKVGERVLLEEGRGQVVGVDPLHDRVMVRFDETGQRILCKVAEVEVLRSSNRKKQDDATQGAYLWQQESPIKLVK